MNLAEPIVFSFIMFFIANARFNVTAKGNPPATTTILTAMVKNADLIVAITETPGGYM